MSNLKKTESRSMSSLGDSPARTSAAQGKAKGSKQNALGCGRRCFDSSEMYGQRGQLLKMFQPLDLKGLPWSFKISARSGIALNGIVYPLVPLARLTRETGFGLWHTPLASAPSPAYEKRYPGGKTRKHPIPNLAAEVQEGIPYSVKSAMRKDPKIQWPTPAASNDKTPQPDRVEKGKNGNYILRKKAKPHMTYGARLQDAVVYEENQLKQNWPTPTAVNILSKERVDRGESHRNLVEVVYERDKMHPAAGQLNPTWVEWLMGYPSGWTDLNNLATV